jgi:hypothetical protein
MDQALNGASQVMPSNSPVILIYSTVCWPLAARLAICFRDLGCRVHSICPDGHPLHFVRGIERCHPTRSWSAQHSLLKAIQVAHPDYVVPTDDRALGELHALASDHPQYLELMVRSLGASKSFEVVRSRVDLLALAESLQIRTPRTVRLLSLQKATCHANSWNYPAFVKCDGTFAGAGVAIVRTPRELVYAYQRLRRGAPLAVRLKRRLVDGDIFAFSRSSARSPRQISLQSFVPGTPANAMYSCFQGKLLASLQVSTICAQYATGAALIVKRLNDPRIQEAGKKIAMALTLSGFFGLDFLLEKGSGYPYLIEMNPRATQLGHLPLENQIEGASLAEALWRAWTGNRSRRPAAPLTPTKLPERIAFYPQALMLGANNSLVNSAYLDRPDQEPELLRELSKTVLPERRLLYRLIHRLYIAHRKEPVVFPDPEDGTGPF